MESVCSRCGRRFESGIASGLKDVCPACVADLVADIDSATMEVADTAPLPFQPGATFRGMAVGEILGQGGMGVVYKARQSHLDREVALKILSPKLAADPEFAQRFVREAKTLAALNHPGIVQVYDFGREGDVFFLAMEYVDGISLRGLLRRKEVTPEVALRLVPQICEALEYAHSKGVVHRDIKPENILVGREGHVKLADFGLAKATTKGEAQVTKTNVVMGTPHYMAPEQQEGLTGVDHRADIYALGVVLYEMLTGEVPVGRFDLPSHRVRIDVRLDQVVLKALEARPERRYQAVAEVKEAVTRITSSSPQLGLEEEEARLRKTAATLSDLLAGRVDLPHPSSRASRLRVRTSLLGAGTVAGAALVFLGMGVQPALVVTTPLVILFLWFLIPDLLVPSVDSATSPSRAAWVFFGALRWGLWRRAYACLSPMDKTERLRTTPHLSPLKANRRKFSFDMGKGFARYWCTIVRNPVQAAAGEDIKRVRWKLDGVEHLSDGLARVHATLRISGYPRWTSVAQLGILVFLGMLACVIHSGPITLLTGVAALTAVFLLPRVLYRSTHLVVEKLAYRRLGRWYLLNGEAESPEDRLSLAQSLKSA